MKKADLGQFLMKRQPPKVPEKVEDTIVPDVAIQKAVEDINGSELLKLLLQKVNRHDYPAKGADEDYNRVKKVVERMHNDLLHSFLKVNFSLSKRSIQSKDWKNLCACQKSAAGTYGIYFLQCGDRSEPDPTGRNGIVVAKDYTADEFERTEFITDLAIVYLQIKCPKVRYIPRVDPEFSALKTAAENMFTVFPELYEFGGSVSPKKLFQREGIMLIEFIKGETLAGCQRFLTHPDYVEIGKIFFLDLLICNSDRFPCRKIFRRPNSTSIQDDGNAGNIMFGEEKSDVFSIDPELKIRPEHEWDGWKDQYIKAVESVVIEVISRQDQDYTYSSINELFFGIIPGFKDILPNSINDIRNWEKQSSTVQEGIGIVLQMIRMKLRSVQHLALEGLSVPATNEEHAWREFITAFAPRVMEDLFQFIEAHLRKPRPYDAADGFYEGFKFALDTAISGKDMIEGKVANGKGSHHLKFVLEVIKHLEERCQGMGLFNTSLLSSASLMRVNSGMSVHLR